SQLACWPESTFMSSWSCVATENRGTTQVARDARLVRLTPRLRQRLPASQRMRERAAVDVLELATDRHTVRNPARFDLATRGDLGNDVRGRVALDRRVRREDRLLHTAFREQGVELREAELVRTDAIEGRKMSHEHEITAAIAARLLDRGDVSRRFDDTE